MFNKTITQIAKDLANKKYSSVELTETFFKRIKQYEPDLNCFITLTKDSALTAAKIADNNRAKNLDKQNLLAGIPLAIKDNFCTENIRTTCGSKMLSNFIAPYDATVIAKLKKVESVFLGKTNMDEFAMGSSNENSAFKNVKNPWDLQCVPGGSSGGSAAAVAARFAVAALGSDTGGSIRQPASLCGVVGLKPTYGRVSRFGLAAFASSLDQPGILTKTAEDAAILLQAIAGFDTKDSTSVAEFVPDYSATLNDAIKGLKIGLPKEYFANNFNAGVALAIDEAISLLEKLGAKVKEVDLPMHQYAMPVYYIIATAECSSNLARYDGVRYGFCCEDAKDFDDLISRSRGEGFGAEVKRRILIGTYVLAAKHYGAYYLKAQKVRNLISEDFQKVFRKVDVILGPTTPTPAFKLGAKTTDPLSMYSSDIYTIAANLAGLPAISIPVGFVGALPIGMQLMGNYFSEARILNVAHKYQQATDWHLAMPELF